MEFKYGATTYDFEDMKVYNKSGWWKLIVFNNELHRMGQNKLYKISPVVNDAYFEYEIENILLKDK